MKNGKRYLRYTGQPSSGCDFRRIVELANGGRCGYCYRPATWLYQFWCNQHNHGNTGLACDWHLPHHS